MIDFTIRGKDVVISQGGKFVSILKDGVNNPAVQRAIAAAGGG